MVGLLRTQIGEELIARRRPPLNSREIGIILGTSLVAVIVAGALVCANTRWSSVAGGGGTFYSIWAGTRAGILEHQDPYGTAIAARAQQYSLGAAAGPTQNPYRLDLPFFLLQLSFPIALIPDADVARGIWMTLAEMALVAAVFMGCRLADWRPGRGSLAAMSLAFLFCLPSVDAVVAGSLTPFLLLAYLAVIWAIRTGADEIAGGLLVACMCKWEVGIALLAIVALQVFRERRWRIVGGFGMALTLLVLLSLLVRPDWFMPFLTATVGMLRLPHGYSTYTLLQGLIPDQGLAVARALTLVVVLMLFLEWLGTRTVDSRRFVWLVGLALAATPLLGLRAEAGDLIVVIPGFLFAAAAASGRRQFGRWFAGAWVCLLFVVPWILAAPWWHSAAWYREGLELLALSVVCLMGLFWTRWWLLRPARTWLDAIRNAQ